MNFGSPGVAVLLFVFGALIAAVEALARARPTWGRVLAYAAAIVVAPRWVWYGDLYVIRAAMACATVWLAV